MNEHPCPVVRIEKIEKHSNADSLSITEVEGNPVIFRTADFNLGDLAVYIPIESLIPEGREWVKKYASHLTFKSGWHRVKAVRLRGVFSMGILVPFAALDYASGGAAPTDVSGVLGIEHYEELEEVVVQAKGKAGFLRRILQYICYKLGIRRKPKARLFPVYGVENYRKGRQALIDGEEVVLTEKRHGSNFVAVHHKSKLIVSSHKVVRGAEDNSWYWRVARDLDLANRLKSHPNLAFMGEIFGPGVQDLTYGVPPNQLRCEFFDIYDIDAKEFLSYDQAYATLGAVGLDPVPVIYRGPHSKDVVLGHAEGKSTSANHMREGVVVRRAVGQRCVLKAVSEAYLLRKGGTEKH